MVSTESWPKRNNTRCTTAIPAAETAVLSVCEAGCSCPVTLSILSLQCEIVVQLSSRAVKKLSRGEWLLKIGVHMSFGAEMSARWADIVPGNAGEQLGFSLFFVIGAYRL